MRVRFEAEHEAGNHFDFTRAVEETRHRKPDEFPRFLSFQRFVARKISTPVAATSSERGALRVPSEADPNAYGHTVPRSECVDDER